MKPVVFHCEANVELVAATKYYECQRSGLGREFLHAVHALLGRVSLNPQGFGFNVAPVRACRVGRFPYRLIYEELPDAVVVTAVMHTSREPGYWKNRLT